MRFVKGMDFVKIKEKSITSTLGLICPICLNRLKR